MDAGATSAAIPSLRTPIALGTLESLLENPREWLTTPRLHLWRLLAGLNAATQRTLDLHQ
ncbi:unnamed protein product, partial [Timema podura]|nr:unnamed protein product [Timema podura]